MSVGMVRMNEFAVVKKYSNLFLLKKTWNSICSCNDSILPLQYFDYYKHLFISFYSNHILSRWRILFFRLSNGKDTCIIPLVVNKKKHLIRGLSCFGRLDYEDVVSSTTDKAFVGGCIRKVLESYKGYRLELVNLNEHGTLYGSLGDGMKFRERCVAIELSDSFDDYFSKLSKHQRQNVRTAFNKLQKESFSYRLVQYDRDNPIPSNIWRLCQRIYESRHETKGSQLKIWIDRQKNPYTHILRSVEGWRIYVLFHEEVPVAYMGGLLDQKQNCYYVPRLCINPDYSFYSPGIVLIAETIKLLIKECVKRVDLMLGDEPYKIAMGGKTHDNFELSCIVDVFFE